LAKDSRLAFAKIDPPVFSLPSAKISYLKAVSDFPDRLQASILLLSALVPSLKFRRKLVLEILP
jgi:hypothetical protein